jgi:hypothetical protein
MQSPRTAWRPCPMLSGPVGFAETNSTCTRCPLRASPRPNSAGRARMLPSSACQRASASQRFTNPGRRPPRGPRGQARGQELHQAVASSRRAQARHHERRVAGEVAVLLLARHLERPGGQRIDLRGSLAELRPQDFLDAGDQPLAHGGRASPRGLSASRIRWPRGRLARTMICPGARPGRRISLMVIALRPPLSRSGGDLLRTSARCSASRSWWPRSHRSDAGVRIQHARAPPAEWRRRAGSASSSPFVEAGQHTRGRGRRSARPGRGAPGCGLVIPGV